MINLINTSDADGKRVYKMLAGEILKRAIRDAEKPVQTRENGVYVNASNEARLFLLNFEDSYLNDILELSSWEIKKILQSVNYESWGEIENVYIPNHKETAKERNRRYYLKRAKKTRQQI